MSMKHSYGWVRDLPDHRDNFFSIPLAATALPAHVDLRAQCPPVYDQGQLGSCTANAIVAAVDFERNKQGFPLLFPSRLFVYYNERAKEHTVNSDAGARIRDGIKSVGTQGAPPEALWPYDIAKFELRPPDSAYAKAKLDRAISYLRLNQQVVSQLKGCLAAGYPFVFGITVYESFEGDQVAQTGMVPMPSLSEKVLGGHAIMAVGYDDAKQCFIVRNSWGTKWGIEGYCMFPYAYLTDTNLASDFWTIRLVAPQAAAKAA
jgi:C1A family cysteine protease